MRRAIAVVAILNVVLAALFAALAASTGRLALTAGLAAGLAASLVAIGLLCWVPFVYRILRAVTRLDEAARQMAEGRLAEGRMSARAPEQGDNELGSLGRSINNLASRSEQMIKSQKRFLGDVAHELTAPIARVQFALGVIEATVDPAGQADVKALHDEVQDMSALVSELLSYSKAGMDVGAAPLAEVNVQQAVQRASDRENIPVAIEVEPGLTAMAHEVYLARAVGNLLRNARRYAGAAGPIEVSARREGGQVQLIVADRGPGLPEADLEQIFEPFYRVDPSRTRSTGGKGLGLAIVKSCVEVCRGQVQCRNRQPTGLEVVIRLPVVSDG